MARKQAFNDKAIRVLHTGKLPDPATAGLSVEAKAGVHTWRYYRRVRGAADLVRVTLGTYPAYSIPMARKWAAGLNEQVEAGIDPRAAERAAKAAAMTVSDAWALYIAAVERGDRRTLKARTIADKRAIWERDMKPHIGRKRLLDLTPDHLWDMVEAKGATAPVRANRLAAEAKVFLGWCVSRDAQRACVALSANPATSLNGNHYAQSAGGTRMLSNDEIGWFVAALADEKPSYRRALMLMLLTGCRFSEVVEALVSEHDAGTWTIPGSRTKNGRAHVIALGPMGRKFFEEANGKWLAPNTGGGGLIEQRRWYHVRDRVHARMERLAERSLDRWGFHDLRRTLRSNTFRLGIAFEVAEAMLNHARQGLERRYDVGDLSDFTRDGFARWEAHVVSLEARAINKRLTSCYG